MLTAERPRPARVRRKRAGRLVVVDALRGFALLGIVLVHALAFAVPGTPPAFAPWETAADRHVVATVMVLLESKFFALFTFLFGLSFALLLRGGRASGRMLRRRLLGLAAFGALHVLLLWEGDVLLLYALVGFALLVLRGQPERVQWRLALGMLLGPPLLLGVGFVGLLVLRASPDTAGYFARMDAMVLRTFAGLHAESLRVHAQGSYVEVLALRLERYAGTFALLASRTPMVLGMFLLGLLAGRAGTLAAPDAHAGLLRRVAWWGVPSGLLLGTLIVLAVASLPATSAVITLAFNQMLAGPLLGLGYAAVFVLLASRSGRPWLLKPLAAVGRTALSAYLLQSLALTLVFHGYGLGLVGQVSAQQALAIGALIFALQSALAVWWLHRYRYGPLEWAWRSWTRGKVQVLRRQSEPRRE